MQDAGETERVQAVASTQHGLLLLDRLDRLALHRAAGREEKAGQDVPHGWVAKEPYRLSLASRRLTPAISAREFFEKSDSLKAVFPEG